mgnify:CR=1 FL=1|jgi:hypothetical protein
MSRFCSETYIEIETLQQLLTIPDVTTYAGLRDYALILLTMEITLFS